MSKPVNSANPIAIIKAPSSHVYNHKTKKKANHTVDSVTLLKDEDNMHCNLFSYKKERRPVKDIQP